MGMLDSVLKYDFEMINDISEERFIQRVVTYIVYIFWKYLCGHFLSSFCLSFERSVLPLEEFFQNTLSS